jgi:6-phosphogluconolactonase
VIHPAGTHAYLAGETDSTVNIFAYDAAAGTMSFLEAVSSLPRDFVGDNTTADIHVTPDGSFVYISNRGHDSLAMFEVAGDSLTPLGHAPTEPRPREFGLTPDGRFVYVAGQDSGMLASYVVQADGTLAAGDVYPVGGNPLWVVGAELPPR